MLPLLVKQDGGGHRVGGLLPLVVEEAGVAQVKALGGDAMVHEEAGLREEVLVEVRGLLRTLVLRRRHPQEVEVGLPVLAPVQGPVARPRVPGQLHGLPGHDQPERAGLERWVLGVVRPSLLQHLQARSAHGAGNVQLQVLVKVGLVRGGDAVDQAANLVLLQDLRRVQVHVAQNAAGREHTSRLHEQRLADALGHLMCHLADRHELQGCISETA
mmetsp:Transcript_66609/g.177400  ORF Transcript_66609/g.177400 Transcript_66609/m.177400 type:complete len:215 (+) Transcript_66609:372-1016(+)